METGEECDDGNTVQCDGCDNACKTSTVGCLRNGMCVAGALSDAGVCPP